MSQLLSKFPWPAQPGASILPRWSGTGFKVAHHSVPVLAYEELTSNWSDDLTELHEHEAGKHHPIDVASRTFALETLRQFMGGRNDALALEIGCSSGYLIEDIRREIPGLSLIGSDYIRKPLEALAARIPSVPLLQFDLRRCPLPSECVDAVVLLNVLEHIDDDQCALRQVARILKPGGIAHIEVPSNPDCYDIYDEHLMHHRRYRMKELLRLAENAGFEVLRATHLGFFVYPAFYAVKQRNKTLLARSSDEKQALVARQIKGTSKSLLLGPIMRVEMMLGQIVSYPCGIRCVAILRKKPPIG